MAGLRFPVWAIIVDVFGTLLVAGGIFFLAFDGDVIGIQADDRKGAGIAMIVVGVMLMVPLVVFAIRSAASGRR